jgi:regulator of cell morphogenesis and NO signaling
MIITEPCDATRVDDSDWSKTTLVELIRHIQARFHEPLREELPRLAAMMTTIVEHHGDRLPHVLPPLRWTFDVLRTELIDHLQKEDDALFPAVTRLASEVKSGVSANADWWWVIQLIDIIEADHDGAIAAFAEMRELTHDYAAPAEAWPSLQALYQGLAELERTTRVHAQLENDVLFPRAIRLVSNK